MNRLLEVALENRREMRKKIVEMCLAFVILTKEGGTECLCPGGLREIGRLREQSELD